MALAIPFMRVCHRCCIHDPPATLPKCSPAPAPYPRHPTRHCGGLHIHRTCVRVYRVRGWSGGTSFLYLHFFIHPASETRVGVEYASPLFRAPLNGFPLPSPGGTRSWPPPSTGAVPLHGQPPTRVLLSLSSCTLSTSSRASSPRPCLLFLFVPCVFLMPSRPPLSNSPTTEIVSSEFPPRLSSTLFAPSSTRLSAPSAPVSDVAPSLDF